VIQQNLANLRQTIAAYGLPDQTWNLAWLTVVFAETPGREAAQLTAQLASRLVDGQLRDGPGRGLWGPESFHHRLLAVVIRNYLAREAELKEANQKLAKRDTATNREAVEEATSALEREKSLLDSVTRQALRFAQVEFPYFWDPNADPKVLFSGVRSFLYNQAAADLESTAVALLGLAAAAEHGRLPAQSLRPEPPKVGLGRPTTANPPLAVAAPPESALATLARAANALAARRAKDGRWNEANVHQPVTDFDTFQNLLPVPADAKSFIALESPVTPASVAQGAAAFTAIGRAVGRQQFSADLRQVHDAGRATASQELAGWVATRRPTGNQPAQLSPADYLTLPPVAELLGHTNLTGIVADELIRWLVLAGETNGCWRPSNLGFYVSTSSRARLAALKTLKGQVIISSVDPVELQKAHIWVTNAGPGDPNGSPIARDAEGYATALVLLCLTSRLENPAAALVEFGGEPPLTDLRIAAHARLRQPLPKTVPVEPTAPVPPAPATATDVPALPPPADHAPRPDEKF